MQECWGTAELTWLTGVRWLVRLSVRERHACRAFEEEYKPGHPGVGEARSGICCGSGGLHIDHARLRSSAVRLSRCLQTGVSRKEGDKLVDESRSLLPQLRTPHQGPCSWWVLTVLSLGLFKRSHYHTCPWRPCMEDTSCWHWNTVFVTDWGGSGEGITKDNDGTGDQAMDACTRPFVSPRKELCQLLT